MNRPSSTYYSTNTYTTSTTFSSGGYFGYGGSYYLTGYISEWIYWNVDKSNNLTQLRNNICVYFGIN